MKLNRNILAIVLSTFLISIAFPDVVVRPAFGQKQGSAGALQRGYRTGYSDGFMAGYKDMIDSSPKDYSRHADYTKADRAYNKDYGSLEDYRDGYQQGFESGYDTGFAKRSFNSDLPADLSKRVVTVKPTETAGGDPVDSSETAATGTSNTETAATETATTETKAAE